MSQDLTLLSASHTADAVKKGEITAEAVTRAALTRIAALEPTVKAFLAVTKDLALAQARALALQRGEDLDDAGVGLVGQLERGFDHKAGSGRPASEKPLARSLQESQTLHCLACPA